MADTTDLHGYQLFSDGEENWEHRTDFQQLDIDVEVRGDTDPETAGVTPKNGAMYRDTSTGEIYIGDGDSWNLQWDLGAIGTGSVGNSISVQNMTGEVYAREFSGASLSEKIENALAELAGGYGRIRVTPKPDGTAWTWDTDLTIDITQYNGLDLDIDKTVPIEYTGDGWALTITGSGGATDTQASITGGVWTNTGDPAGWLRIQDCFGTRVFPTEVEMRNSTDDATGVSIQNVDSWSESTRVGGAYRADIGIDTVPASVTGGTGTESFHDTVLDNPKINAYSIGIRMRGYFDYCHVIKPAVWPKADGASCYVLGATRMDGTTIIGLKAESSGGTNHIGIETVDGFEGFWYGPTILGGRFDIDGQNFQNNGGVSGSAPYIRTWERNFEIADLTGNDGAGLNVEGDGTFQNITANGINGGGPITDGDGTERNIWVIPAGASDPADATAEDIIFEEES